MNQIQFLNIMSEIMKNIDTKASSSSLVDWRTSCKKEKSLPPEKEVQLMKELKSVIEGKTRDEIYCHLTM
jgi:hypothetical protein